MRNFGSRLLWACLATVLVAFAEEDASAQREAERGTLSLDEALRRALDDNPALRAAGLAIDIERRRRDLEAQPRPLTLQAEIENFAGSGTASGFGDSETTLQISRVLERGGKPALRREVGEHGVARAEIAEEAARLRVATDVAQRFIELVALQERLALAEEAVDVAARMLDVVRARVEVGRSSEADEATAHVALSRAELERLAVAHRLESARMSLATLWGADFPDFERVVGNLYDLPTVDAFAQLEQRLADNPELLLAAAEQRQGAARRRLALSKREPDIAISGGLRRLAEHDDVALVVSMSVPLGNVSRARAEIDEAELRMTQSPLEAEARRRALRAALFESYQELTLARTIAEALRNDIIPEAEDAVALYEEGFGLGSSTLLELVEAQDRLVSLRGEALDAARDYHSTLAEIEYLLGGRRGAAR